MAANALGNLKDKRAVEPLILALQDQASEVRWEAVAALNKITGQRINENPIEWRKWWENNK